MNRTCTVIIMLSSLFGCAPGLQTRGPLPPGADQPGLRYHLGKDVLVVTGDVTYSVTKTVKKVDLNKADPNNKVPKGLDVATEVKYVASTINTSLLTVADPVHAYLLNLEPGGGKDKSLSIAVGENGLLTSVNVTTVDRTGEAITNIGKAVASIAGTFVGFRTAEAADPGETYNEIFNQKVAPELAKLKADGVAQALVRARFDELPVELVYFISESPEVARVWTAVALDEVRLGQQAGARTALYEQAAAEADEARAKQLDRAIVFRTRVVDELQKQFSDRRAQLESLVERERSRLGLGRKDYVRAVAHTLELTELPTLAELGKGPWTESQVRAALKFAKREVALALFDEAKVVITMDAVRGASPQAGGALAPGGAVPAPVDGGVAPSPVEGGDGGVAPRPVDEGGGRTDARMLSAVADSPPSPAAPAPDVNARIRYRPGTPVLIRTFGLRAAVNLAAKDATETVVQLGQANVVAVDPRTKPAYAEFDPKAFSNQSLALGFNAKGQLVSASQGATSPLAGATQAATGAITGARDEFATSLTKAKEIQATRNQIELAELQHRIDQLTKRKQVVDNRLALAGANANYDVMLEKLEVDQQLALLQQQQALNRQQAVGDTTLEQEKVKAEVALLTQQVEMLKQEIAKLKLEAELAELRKPK